MGDEGSSTLEIDARRLSTREPTLLADSNRWRRDMCFTECVCGGWRGGDEMEGESE